MKNAILYYKTTENGIDYNNAKLFVGDKEYTLQHLTKSGYYSKKPLYLPNFKTTFFLDGDIEPALGISDEDALYLIEHYTNLGGKIFRTEREKYYVNKSESDKAICSAIKDPYDRG